MKDKDKYMTTKEAVSFTGKSINTIRRAIKKGTLVSKLVNGKRFILISSIASAYGLTPLTQEAPTQEAPTQEAPTQEAPTQSTPTQSTQEAPTQSAPTQKPLTQELLTEDNDKQLAHDHNPAYLMFNLIEVLKAELRVKNQQLRAKDEQLRAKDEQLRVKDEQIAQLMHVLQMGLIKQLPAATQEVLTQEPPTQEPPTQEPPTQEPPTQEPPTQEPPTQGAPTQEPPAEKGFWVAVRKRFGR